MKDFKKKLCIVVSMVSLFFFTLGFQIGIRL